MLINAAMSDGLFLGGSIGLQYKRLDRIGDVLQAERATFAR